MPLPLLWYGRRDVFVVMIKRIAACEAPALVADKGNSEPNIGKNQLSEGSTSLLKNHQPP